MAEAFLSLPDRDRRDVLREAADRSGRRPHLLEKDVWVVWTLSALFGTDFGRDLTFKGGTSLSKAYRAIDRFSEDVDLTYDIRALLRGRADVGDGMPGGNGEARSGPTWSASTCRAGWPRG